MPQLAAANGTVSVHFVNNVLAAAASYIEEDPDAARDALAELGAFLTHRLRPARAVSLQEELDHVGVYLRLQEFRFPGRLDSDRARRRRRRASSSAPATCSARWAPRSTRGSRAAPAACACACARPATISNFASTRPTPPTSKRSLCPSISPRACGAANDNRAGHPRRRRRAASAGGRVAPAGVLGLRGPRRDRHEREGGARVPLGRPLRRALPRRRDARDRGHGARAAAAPLRRPARGRVPHRPSRRRGRGLRGPGARLPGQAGHPRAPRRRAAPRGGPRKRSHPPRRAGGRIGARRW